MEKRREALFFSWENVLHIMHNDRKQNKGNNRPITFFSEQMFAIFKFIPEI